VARRVLSWTGSTHLKVAEMLATPALIDMLELMTTGLAPSVAAIRALIASRNATFWVSQGEAPTKSETPSSQTVGYPGTL
jgi:hypothetical protein